MVGASLWLDSYFRPPSWIGNNACNNVSNVNIVFSRCYNADIRLNKTSFWNTTTTSTNTSSYITGIFKLRIFFYCFHHISGLNCRWIEEMRELITMVFRFLTVSRCQLITLWWFDCLPLLGCFGRSIKKDNVRYFLDCIWVVIIAVLKWIFCCSSKCL